MTEPWTAGAPPNQARLIDATALAACVVLGLMIAVGYHGPPRVLLAVLFATVIPGWAALPRLSVGHAAAWAALSVGLSLALVTTGAVTMVWLHIWNPTALFVVLAGASCARIGARLMQPTRAGSS